MLGVAHVVQRAVERRAQPLVRVDDERVGALDAVPHPAALGQDHRRAGHRRVHVQPGAGAARARRRSAPTGSSAVVVVVPVVATTAHGIVPARASRRPSLRRARRRASRNARRGHEADVVAPETGEQRRLVHRAVGVRGGVDDERAFARACRPPRASAYSTLRSRAQIRATSVLVDAVSWMTPLQASDRPIICRIQSQTTSSSSVSAGLDCHESPSTPSPVLRKSPSTLARAPLRGEIAEERGMLPVREARRTMTRSRSRSTSSNGSGSVGRRRRQRAP